MPRFIKYGTGAPIRPAIKAIGSKVKSAIKKLSTPRDITEGGKYEVKRYGTGLIRTKVKK